MKSIASHFKTRMRQTRVILFVLFLSHNIGWADPEEKKIVYQYAAFPAAEKVAGGNDLREPAKDGASGDDMRQLIGAEEISLIVFTRKYHRIDSEGFFKEMCDTIKGEDVKIVDVSTKDIGDEFNELARGIIHYNKRPPLQFVLKGNPARKDQFFLVLLGSSAFEERRFRVN